MNNKSVKGKIVKISSNLGFIEYGEGERVSYVYKDYKEFKIGDNIKFELILKSVVGTSQTFNRAINLKLVDVPKPNFIRLNKVLRELNISLDKAIEFFDKINVDIEKRPTTKISIENYRLLSNYVDGIEIDFDTIENADKTESPLAIERGTIVETDIVEIIHPSLIIVDFFNNQKAILPLQNLSWNIFQSQKIFSTLKVGSRYKYNLTSHHTLKNVLYNFISNGDIKYIGKTQMQLSQRMYGYQNPGTSQTTNIRVNAAIKDLLANDQPVDIFILTDNGLLRYGDFRINLLAGLEDTLIYEINPDWNLSGRNLIPIDTASEKPELTKEPKSTIELIPVLTTINILLGQAYYNQGFFNVGREYSEMFGADNANIDIQLGSSEDKTIQGYINRTANQNGTPRIMGGKELRNWVKSTFQPDDTMRVDIISPIAVRLH